MSGDGERGAFLAQAVAGLISGALIESFGEIAKELRAYAGRDFDERLDMLEAKAIRSIENAPLDGVAERDQLLLVEAARSVVAAVFRDVRAG